MPIAEKQIWHIARLSKIHLSLSGPAQYARTLTKIIDYFDRLAEIDIAENDRAVHSAGECRLREDVINESLSVDEAMKNAPEKKDNYFIVPRVI